MPDVKCTVCNCDFWEKNNLCVAPSILITSGPHEGKDAMGKNASRLDGEPVRLAEEAYCLTFRPRQEAYIEDDDEVDAPLAIPSLM